MKAKITFNLPDEQEEFKAAMDGSAMSCALHDIDQYLRSQLKHADLTDEVYQTVQEIRNELHGILSGYNLAI